MEDDDSSTGPAPLRCLEEPAAIHRVTDDLANVLAPAEWCIYEWRTYQFVWPGANRLRVGSTWQSPVFPNSFQVQFANQLGLTSLRPYHGETPLTPPIYLEVLARKFQTPYESVTFLRSVLEDLFVHVASLPFDAIASTERRVRESHRPPDDLFAFHFSRHFTSELMRALQAILGRPHRMLADAPEMVRPHEVRRIEPEAVLRMLQTTRRAPYGAIPAAALSPLERLRPERVWQRLPMETFDTPENRFVVTVCRRMYLAIERLQRQRWFQATSIPQPDRMRIGAAREALGMLIADDRFAPLEQANRYPGQSRVLQRRDGYSELTVLWHLFQRASKPVFEHLQHAIDLRDIAELYEFWVLFELRMRIERITGVVGETSDDVDEFGHPGRGQKTAFSGYGTLHYNKRFKGYSGITLYPDFVWEPLHGGLVVLDAKFRMNGPANLFTSSEAASPDNAIIMAKAKDDDLQKMHTYRDAIPAMQAAIVIYPGTESTFVQPNGQPISVTIGDAAKGKLNGIGAIPMRPLATQEPGKTSK